MDSYADPDGFRANLNSTVQSLRSVTNMLQKEKRQVPGFEEWYEDWRDRMKTDEVLVWLDDARTRVFHRGDLEVNSTAEIRIRDEWAPAKVLATDEVSPFESTEFMASGLAAGFIAGFKERTGTAPPEFVILEVERRWVERELPDWELMDALAHAYGVIATVVAEAHERAGARYETADTTHGDPELIDVSHLGGRLPCMVATDAVRTARVKLQSGELLKPEQGWMPYDDALGEIAAKRYHQDTAPRPTSDDPLDIAEWFANQARRVLLVDGYHVPITLLLGPNGMLPIYHPAKDRADKFMNWDAIANHVERVGATAFISIAEAWHYKLPGSELEALIERPRREEQLMVAAATRDGRYRIWTMRFTRGLSGRIIPSPMQVTDTDEPPNFMRAVVDTWARMK